MKILLDTNFILECVKNKIDFTEIDGSLIIPEQVVQELEKIENRDAELALKIIKANKEKFNFISLEKKFADSGIIRYAEKNKCVVATIDKNLKKALKGKAGILTIRARKKIEVI